MRVLLIICCIFCFGTISTAIASHGDLSVRAPGTDEALKGSSLARPPLPENGSSIGLLGLPSATPPAIEQLSQQGLELKSQLAYLRGRRENHEKRLALLAKSRTRQQQELKVANREQAQLQQAFDATRKKLDAATLEYIALTTGVANSRQMGEDQALLGYLSQSNPEDAVLLYQSAAVLIETQTDTLGKLRSAAAEADVATQKLNGNVETREESLAGVERDIEEAERLQEVAARDMVKIRGKIKRYQKLQKKYALLQEKQALLQEKNALLSYRTTGDASTLDDLFEAPPSELAAIARELLRSPRVGYPLDGHSPNGSSKEQMLRIARGLPPMSTCGNSPQAPTRISPRLMYFLRDASRVTSVQINALTDKCHSDTSNHYRGQAVDLDLRSGPLSILTPIAERWGGRKNGEGTHHHIDFP